MRQPPIASDLGTFVRYLEEQHLLKRITYPVSIVHEMTEVHKRVLEEYGPALLFEKPQLANGKISTIPILTNLFGTVERVALGLGVRADELGLLGQRLANLREPPTLSTFSDIWQKIPLARSLWSMRSKIRKHAQCQDIVYRGADVDLDSLPIQWCWPEEPDPLITWPMVITRAPDNATNVNVGVYRLQKLAKNKLIMRWLAHRGGAKHHQLWKKQGRDMPVAIAIGADPPLMLSAVMPLPETMSELAFSGLFRKSPTEVVEGQTVDILVPANAEIIIEGMVSFEDVANEGPYGDHTGYYNAVEPFPVMQVTAITMRKNPIYLSTYTGRPPDEPSRIGEALNQLFVPFVKSQFAEVTDIWLPPEACSYRTMIVALDKRYAGQAKRLMLSLWGMLPQFNYTKIMIAVDPDIDIRNWHDVIWALSTRFDPARDTTILNNMPIDYLDFASPVEGLGSKVALDATTKLPGETTRAWGKVLTMPESVKSKVDEYWKHLGI